MKFRLTILVFFSLLSWYSGGQNLEEVNVRTTKKATANEVVSFDSSENLESEVDVLEEKNILSQTLDQSASTEREAKTYKKEEYLNFILRQIYYQKQTTNPWSKYLHKKAWEKNVLTWRYWSQLKDYISGNDRGVIEIRTPQDANSDDTQTLPLDDVVAQVSTDDLVPDQKLEEDNPDPVGEKEALEPEKKLIEPPVMIEEPTTTSVNKAESNQRQTAEVEAPIVVPPRVEEPAVKKTVQDISPTREFPQNGTKRIQENVDFSSLKGRLPWPVKSGRITDRFGLRKNAAARGLRPENYGIDMYCPGGTFVQAVASGTVLLAKRQSPYDYIVTIKHGDFTTAYYYLITPYVKTGDVVAVGQRIGQLRTSVAEADFHFEIWQNQDRVNPETWLQKR